MSAVQALGNPITYNPTITDIYDLIRDLANRDIRTTIIWIPSHTGIAGNEAADEAAKIAAESTTELDPTPIRWEDVKRLIKRSYLEKWQQDWERTTGKLRAVKSNIKPWIWESDMGRKENVILTRIRIGHTRLTQAYLLLGEYPPICSCGEDLTVEHLLMECPNHRDARARHQIVGELAELLKPGSEKLPKLMIFLKETGNYYHL